MSAGCYLLSKLADPICQFCLWPNKRVPEQSHSGLWNAFKKSTVHLETFTPSTELQYCTKPYWRRIQKRVRGCLAVENIRNSINQKIADDSRSYSDDPNLVPYGHRFPGHPTDFHHICPQRIRGPDYWSVQFTELKAEQMWKAQPWNGIRSYLVTPMFHHVSLFKRPFHELFDGFSWILQGTRWDQYLILDPKTTRTLRICAGETTTQTGVQLLGIGEFSECWWLS